MMKFSVPPGYVRKKPPAKPKLHRFIPVIDGILGDDKSRPKKQQHTAKRIYEAANVLLTRVAKWSTLKAWGIRIASVFR
jgi:hypothetical protein